MKFAEIIFINNIIFAIAIADVENERKNIDQILGERYNFGMFENFEGCAKVYKQEGNMVGDIFDIRSKLSKMAENLRQFMSRQGQSMRKTMKNLLQLKNRLNQYLRSIF